MSGIIRRSSGLIKDELGGKIMTEFVEPRYMRITSKKRESRRINAVRVLKSVR